MYKGLLTATILTLSSTALAGAKSICGVADDRVLSYEAQVGRLSVVGENAGCTVTMISEDCGISAGHCLPVLEKAEFNTPISINAKPQPSDEKDVYMIDKESIQFQNEGPGKDWAVFKLKANEITGKLPGHAQGYHEVSFVRPEMGTMLRITGYGADYYDADGNFAQQTNSGVLTISGSLWGGKSLLQHTVDTMGGNSGSSIINEETGKIIGIHTHGGCTMRGGANSGTLIAKHEKLKAAINACLGR